jgi:hypothetical protein
MTKDKLADKIPIMLHLLDHFLKACKKLSPRWSTGQYFVVQEAVVYKDSFLFLNIFA